MLASTTIEYRIRSSGRRSCIVASKNCSARVRSKGRIGSIRSPPANRSRKLTRRVAASGPTATTMRGGALEGTSPWGAGVSCWPKRSVTPLRSIRNSPMSPPQTAYMSDVFRSPASVRHDFNDARRNDPVARGRPTPRPPPRGLSTNLDCIIPNDTATTPWAVGHHAGSSLSDRVATDPADLQSTLFIHPAEKRVEIAFSKLRKESCQFTGASDRLFARSARF